MPQYSVRVSVRWLSATNLARGALRRLTILRSPICLAAVLSLPVAGCVGLPPVVPESPLGRGRELLAVGQYAQARDAFRDWARDHPGDLRSQLGLGAAFEGLGWLDSRDSRFDQSGTTGWSLTVMTTRLE